MTVSNPQLLDNNIDQKYQLLAKIGAGGMGDVFLAIQRGAVDFSRLVVVKRIHDRQVQQSSDYARMFINEASVVASLNHPHIVKVFDFCMTGPSVCIVMEYVEGETLKYLFSRCNKRKQRIPVGLACRLILDACDALHYAHNSTSLTGKTRKIIHRDIGLHNLMLDSNGYLKIIDFGISKSSMQSDMTSPGLIKGNPGYMAPDLFNETDPDHRVDIYALGLCLYELLTQTRAFKFGSDVTFGKIFQEISSRELAPPSQIMQDLPQGIDALIMKAIEKDRTKRYQTVEAFANDLKKIACNELMSGSESKQWFTTNFESRLKERREFGAKMLELAKKSDKTQDDPIAFSNAVHSSLTNMNAMTSTPSLETDSPHSHTTQVVIEHSNLYKLIGVIFAMFIGCATVLYFVFRDPPAKEVVTVTDNVIVTCNPMGAKLTIDGKELGLIKKNNVALRVEPNKEHEIVLSKEGYRNYSLPFIGPATGSKQINATLIKIETKSKSIDSDTQDSSIKSGTENNPFKRGSHRKAGRKKALRSENQMNDNNAETKNKASAPPYNTEKQRKIPLPDDDDMRKIPLDDDKKTIND